MDSSNVQAQITELEALRKQAGWWRTGATLCVAAIAVTSLATLNSAVRGLAQPGPTQDAFMGHMSEAMKNDIMPTVKTLASQTFTEIQPEIKAEFTKLNQRVPELTQATMKELETLQTELPQTGEKALNDSFDTMLKSKEDKIKSLYPDVTEDQIKTLILNLQESAHKEVIEANKEIFGPHQLELKRILSYMSAIKKSEAANTVGQTPDWEMGLAVLDVVRDDLKTLNKKQNAEKAAEKTPKEKKA